jgi:transcriptional regulator GlxA family with amidase domain
MPDEVHATEEPDDRRQTTRYQVLYVGPDRLRDVAAAIGGDRRRLPFFAEAVLRDPELAVRYQRLHTGFAGGSSQLGRDVDLLATLVALVGRHAHARTDRESQTGPSRAALIARAKRLLVQGLPVSRVAGETGFFDLSHFSRHFKRHVGVSPGGYASTARTYITRTLDPV